MINRDVAFWGPVLKHPLVEPNVLCGLATVEEFLAYLERPEVEEERADGGGLVYVRKAEGHEVHAMFLPEKWGRPATAFIRRSFARKMADGHNLIVREQEGYARSRPPLSYGWRPAGDFEISTHPKRLRKWILTPDAWRRSPIGRKTHDHNC